MSDLPPSKSYGGDWSNPNKVPYTGNWGSDIKPPRRARRKQGCFILLLIICALVVLFLYRTSK